MVWGTGLLKQRSMRLSSAPAQSPSISTLKIFPEEEAEFFRQLLRHTRGDKRLNLQRDSLTPSVEEIWLAGITEVPITTQRVRGRVVFCERANFVGASLFTIMRSERMQIMRTCVYMSYMCVHILVTYYRCMCVCYGVRSGPQLALLQLIAHK